MPLADTKLLDAMSRHIRQKRAEDVSLTDVVQLAELSAEAFQAFFKGMDSALLREMREIAEYISAMKREIGTLQVNDMKNARIPAAGLELGAVAQATEEATNTIMSCAETVMAADPADTAAYKTLVDERMMIIFEACSFQDITGQRIAKVIETLQHIETRVGRFAAAMRPRDVSGPLDTVERAQAERNARLLLHGPPLDGVGNTQVDVDALLDPDGVRGRANSQYDIDRLLA